MSTPTIAFAGMTHLGLVSVVAAAGKGFPVIGFDADVARVASLSEGRLPLHEPGLDDACARNRPRLTFTAELDDIAGCDVVYISTDVPTDDLGVSDLSGIEALVNRVAALDAAFTLVVLCQVPPGFTRALPRRKGPIFYQVETLVFGDALTRAEKPERLIVGCEHPHQPLPAVYRGFLESFGCPILPMRYESAELAKISINCCLVAAVSTANTLADLCERVGADWAEIVPALRLDRRIGHYAYLAPGLGLAGGNLERDLATVLRLSAAAGSESGVVSAWIANSRYRKDWALRTLHRIEAGRPIDAPLGLLGLAYKQDTDSIKNSAAVALVDSLPGRAVNAYDPAVPKGALRRLHLGRVADWRAAVAGAAAVAIMTPWPEFRSISPGELAALMFGRVVIDPHGLLDGEACRAAGLAHYRLGVGHEQGGGDDAGA